MSADEALRKNSTLADIAPDEWFPNRSGTLWVACYRVLRAQVGDFVPPIEIDLGRVRAHFVQGDVTYLDSSDFRIVPVTHDEWRLEGQPTEKNTGEQSLVLLIAPHRVGEEEGNEARTRAAISAAVGLIIAVCGRNAAYEKIFENEIDVGATTSSAFSSVMVNPMSVRAPAIRSNRPTMQAAGRAILHAAPTAAARIHLSLRWIEQAAYDAGVDAFLKQWIAIETMSMPDTTNVVPINRALSKTYGISLAEARARFGVGRLLGLRSDIVHNGATPAINSFLQDYMDALFFDLLASELGLNHEGRAGALIGDHDLDLGSLVTLQTRES